MTAQLADYERQVRHNERLRTLGQLGASMAHQLRNAATGGRMAIELHRRDCPQRPDRRIARRGPAATSPDGVVSAAVPFVRPGRAGRPPAGRLPRRWSKKCLGLVRPSCVHAGIELQFTPPAEPWCCRAIPKRCGNS